jgi:predicted permease
MLWNDLRYSVRALLRTPAFTLIAVVSLALGIGANTAIFSLLDQALIRSLPVRDPLRLVALNTNMPGPGRVSADNSESSWSYPRYKDLRAKVPAFSGLIARMGFAASVNNGSQTDRASIELVSGNFFTVLGVPAAAGRTLLADDEGAPGANPVVVLSHGYWLRRFGGNPAILNQKIGVSGHPMQVVGILGPEFRGVIVGQAPDLYAPVTMKRDITPDWDGLDDRRSAWLTVLGRLAPGVSVEQATAATRTILKPTLEDEAAAAHMSRPRADRFIGQTIALHPAAQGVNELGRTWGKPILVLMAMVGLVLLIACANVASLLVARAAGRSREIAIRLAIGAGRLALFRQLLIEGLLLSTVAAAAGIVIAQWSIELLLRVLADDSLSQSLSVRPDARILGFTALIALLTGVVFGLVPALQTWGTDLASALKETASAVSGSPRARLRTGLVVAQIALSAILLIGAGLFTRSFSNLIAAGPGYRTEHILMFSVDPALNGYSVDRGRTFYRDLQERLGALGGVRGTGAAALKPLEDSNSSSNITVEGYPMREDEDMNSNYNVLAPGYFQTMGIAVLQGREFTQADGPNAPHVAMVNETFAKRFFGGRSPIGRHMSPGGGKDVKLNMEIVGVIRDVRQTSLREAAKPYYYVPYTQTPNLQSLTFVVRTDRDENAFAADVRRIIAQSDPALPVFDVRSMQVQLRNSIATDRLIALLAASFGVLATVLAAIGLYGVIAYMVVRRTAELGIRIALGALAGDVLRIVLGRVALVTLSGMAIGIVVAAGLGRLVESQLYGLTAADPFVFAGAAGLLAVVSVLAGLIPARRAIRIDPIRALRHE